MRWAGLVRVSAGDQLGGAQTQAAEIARWVAERGDTLMGVFSDEGVPGTYEHMHERQGLVTAFGAVAAKMADGVVVWKLDRLARDLVLQEQLILEVQRNYGGVMGSCQAEEMRLLGADDPLADPSRTLVRQILGAVAQYERAIIRLRTDAGRARAVAEHRFMGGIIPYGMQKDPFTKRLVPEPREAAIIGEALELRRLGVTLDEIGEFLLQAGIPPRSARTRRHHKQTVKHILFSAPERGIIRRGLSPLGEQFAASRRLILGSQSF